MSLLVAPLASGLQDHWTNETLAWIAIVPQPVVGRELRFQGKTLVQMHTMFAHGPGIGFVNRIERGFILLDLVVS